MKIEEKYHNPVLSYLSEHGRQGVNNIANGIKMPVSSVDKFLKRQTYFKKTNDAKWDLPENITEERANKQVTTHMSMMVQSLTNMSLLAEDALDTFSSTINALITQVQAIAPLLENVKPPVAKEVNIHPLLLEMDNNVRNNQKLFKTYIKNVPEEYRDLLLNLDLLQLVLDKGKLFVNPFLNNEIAFLVEGQSTELSDDAIRLLEEYQIGTKEDKELAE